MDGHDQWGHYAAKAVRESLLQSLLCRWQEAVALASLIDGEKRLSNCQFDLLRQSYLAAAAAVDEELPGFGALTPTTAAARLCPW